MLKKYFDWNEKWTGYTTVMKQNNDMVKYS